MTIPILLSVALYVIACALPALYLEKSHNKPDEVMTGLNALAFGWTGIFAGVVAWYANPCWLASLLLAFFQRSTAATLVGVLGVIIACTTFSVVGRELPGDEGNVTKMTVTRLLPGFYFWLASIAMAPAAAYLLRGKG